MTDGSPDMDFTAMKIKFKVAKCEKNNTLMYAFGPNNKPLVLKIVSFQI